MILSDCFNFNLNKVLKMTKINLYTKYGSDRQKEKTGVPFYIDKESDTYILVARWCSRNVEHLKAQAEISLQMANVDENEREEARTRVFAEHLITGWNNIVDKNGNDLPFSPKTAVALLEDLPDLVNELVDFSLKRENYGLDSVELATKN